MWFRFWILSEHPFPVPCRLRGRDDETYLQDRLKQWISFSHALIGCSNSGYAVKFTSMRPQTRVSYEQNGFPVYCRNKRRNLTKKLKKLFPEKHEEGDELWFVRVRICLFNWNLSMKSVKRFFVSKRKLSLALLYLADMLINKPKTKLNVFNYVVCFFFFDGRKTCTASSQAFSVIAFRWNIRRQTARRLARTTWPETHRPRAIMRPRDQQSPTLAFGWLLRLWRKYLKVSNFLREILHVWTAIGFSLYDD